LLLTGENQSFRVTTKLMQRKGVTAHYSSGYNYDNSGFRTSFNASAIPHGVYSVAICLYDNKLNSYVKKDTQKKIEL